MDFAIFGQVLGSCMCVLSLAYMCHPEVLFLEVEAPLVAVGSRVQMMGRGCLPGHGSSFRPEQGFVCVFIDDHLEHPIKSQQTKK